MGTETVHLLFPPCKVWIISISQMQRWRAPNSQLTTLQALASLLPIANDQKEYKASRDLTWANVRNYEGSPDKKHCQEFKLCLYGKVTSTKSSKSESAPPTFTLLKTREDPLWGTFSSHPTQPVLFQTLVLFIRWLSRLWFFLLPPITRGW